MVHQRGTGSNRVAQFGPVSLHSRNFETPVGRDESR